MNNDKTIEIETIELPWQEIFKKPPINDNKIIKLYDKDGKEVEIRISPEAIFDNLYVDKFPKDIEND